MNNRKFLRPASEFPNHQDGNIIIIFALMGLILIGLVFFVLDASHQFSLKQEMQAYDDQAVLGACRLGTLQEKESYIKHYIGQNIDQNLVRIDDIEVTETADGKTTSVVRYTPVASYSPLRPDEVNYTISAQCQNTVPKIEVALVADVSVSMTFPALTFGTRLNESKQATISFLRDLLDPTNSAAGNISVSVIPYSSGVNVFETFRYDFPAPFNWLGCFIMEPEDVATLPDHLPIGAPYTTDNVTVVPEPPEVFCPSEAERAYFNSDHLATLEAGVNRWGSRPNTRSELTLGTSTDVGMTWGLWALHPKYKGSFGGDFPDRPADPSTTKKVLILFTDGQITDSHFADPDYTGSGFAFYYKKQVAIQRFLAACSLARSIDVQIYTISYFENSGELADVLKSCSGSERFYFAADGQLENILKEINENILEIRLTQ